MSANSTGASVRSRKRSNGSAESRAFEQYFTQKRQYVSEEMQSTPSSGQRHHNQHPIDYKFTYIPSPPIANATLFHSPQPPDTPVDSFHRELYHDAPTKPHIASAQRKSSSVFDKMMLQSRGREQSKQPTGQKKPMQCWQCQCSVGRAVNCSVCLRLYCQTKCLRGCEQCGQVACSFCTERDYSSAFDRLICLHCIHNQTSDCAMDI